MTGGTWIAENKMRPGAYCNFRPVAKAKSQIADAGVATMPLVMSWGPEGEVMEITARDFLDGAAKSRIGYDGNDGESMLFRECLAHCHTLLAYRVNGGVAATAALGNLTATAFYRGLRGNDIRVAVVAAAAGFEVVTYLSGAEADRQSAATVEELADNDWVRFGGEGALAVTAPVALRGGEDGDASPAAYGAYFEAMRLRNWQVMGIPSADPTLPPLLKAYIYDLRENQGKKVQGVAYDYAADYEGILSAKQGYKKKTETVAPVDFIAWLTGAAAGAETNESLTYRVVGDAVEILPPLSDQEIVAGLAQGFFLLSRRIDGAVIVEQDINTLISYGPEKSRAFAKNRVIRTLDEIGNQVALVFSLYYIGKVGNDNAGRDLFKADVIKICRDLEAARGIQNFDAKEDVAIEAGAEGDSVLVHLAVQPVDSMEKLYMTVEVQG